TIKKGEIKVVSREEIYAQLSRLALSDFGDVVENTKIIEGKLRLMLIDGSFMDVWFSIKKRGIYAYHWERREIDGTIYRYNNLPDKKAKKLKTYPKHFHNKSESNVLESNLSDKPEEALRTILDSVRKIIR
ncbi:MAG: DUF6516 family protein, partial [bacterium]